MINTLHTINDTLPRILVVDDSNVNLQLLSLLLVDYDVITINNGVDAIELAAKEHVDLILLDIMMPDMDGYEVCVRLKKIDKTKDIPIIFITANTDEESIDNAYKVGGIDYVTKPFKSKELLARVKTQLSFHFLQTELEEKIALIDKYVSFSSTDRNGIITEVSGAFCELSGYTREELIGKKHSILRHSDMDKEIYTDMWKTIISGKSWNGDIKNRKKDGGYFWVSALITQRYYVKGNVVGYTAIRQDITNEKVVEELSITDQLTDLYNRRHFNETFPVEIKRSIRQGSFLSLIMLDIDFFKQYNDTYGHLEGDRVLKELGKALKGQLNRSEDLIYRLGGEEFGVVYAVNSYDDAKNIAQGVLDAITELNIEHKMSLLASKKLSASIGLATLNYSNRQNYTITLDEFYKLADNELYKAKVQGRNRLSMVKL